VNEGHFEHTAEVLGGFLETGEDTTALFEPADQPFDDVAFSILVPIELDSTRITVLVLLGRNHGADTQFHEVFINPIRTISFVASHRHGPSNADAITIENIRIRILQQPIEDRGFVGLASREMELKWIAVSVAKQMDFRRKTPARPA